MNKHKKILLSLVAVFIALLAAGLFYVKLLPVKNFSFHTDAVDAGLGTFSEISKAKILKVISEEAEITSRYSQLNGVYEARILNGPEANLVVTAELSEQVTELNSQKLQEGDEIVIGKIKDPESSSYIIIDRYRLDALAWLVGIFVFLGLLFGRRKGVLSLMGLAFSILILLKFVAPSILEGKDPVLVTILGAGMISVVSIFLSHGFNNRTLVAVVSTVLVLLLTLVGAWSFILAGKFLGLGSNEALYLELGLLKGFDLRGIFLAGVVISTLGVLDDVTTTQAATVEEIKLVKPEAGFRELFSRANSVGKEHISSLINTLVLAYAGASFPFFLLLTFSSTQPLWAVLNSEALAEEILRTLVGSAALILAVPLTTALAAWYFRQKP
ncbi:MAG: YibE/F family protein [Candidatus Doudnabacteria bacterium]|nr:YibE/F family protein [Candidatus Doudnabacteria bacterium]